MKFEIENEFDNSLNTYSFKKKSITIGRSKDCDICIQADGISRVHVEIQEKADGSFRIIDKGSSNGTFINEEKLNPDEETEFNTFFPAKLGFGIVVSLVDDDGISSGSSSNTTKDDASAFLASQGIKTSNSTSPKMDIERVRQSSTGGRKGGAERRYSGKSKNKDKEEEKKKKKNKKPMGLGLKLIIFSGLAYGYWEFVAKKEIAEENKPVVKTPVVQNQSANKTQAKQVEPPKKFVFPKKPQEIVNKEKCVTPLEKQLCNGVIKTSFADGVFVLGDTIYLSFDGTKEYQALIKRFKIQQSEIEELEKLAKRQQGIRFSKVLFMRNNYRIGINTKEELANILVSSPLLNASLINGFKSNESYNNLAIVIYRNANGALTPIATGHLTRENLKKIEVQGMKSVTSAFKYALLSGYKLDFNSMIWKYFNQPY